MMMDYDELILSGYEDADLPALNGVGVYLVGDKLMNTSEERIVIIYDNSEAEDPTFDTDNFKESYLIEHEIIGDYDYLEAKKRFKTIVNASKTVLRSVGGLIERLQADYNTYGVLKRVYITVSFEDEEVTNDRYRIRLMS